MGHSTIIMCLRIDLGSVVSTLVFVMANFVFRKSHHLRGKLEVLACRPLKSKSRYYRIRDDLG